jgi:hypothetical protein
MTARVEHILLGIDVLLPAGTCCVTPIACVAGTIVTLWIGSVLAGPRDDGMTARVGHEPPFLGGDGNILALQAHQDLVYRIVHVLAADSILVPAGREDGGLVEQVLQVRPAEAGRAPGYFLQIHVVGQGFVAGVNLEDLQPVLQGGQIDGNAAVEAAGPQQGGVQDIRATIL